MTIKAKIVAISNGIRLTKEGENPFQKFSYFKPDDILKALTPLLAEFKLFMSFNLPYNHEKNMYEAVLYFEDLEDEKQNITYKFDIPLTKVAGASEAQGAGATMTYAKRYSIMNAFSIADNSDDLDAKNAGQEVRKETTTQMKGMGDEVKICPVPDCGHQMIRQTNKKNPKAPDWKCSDRNCKFSKAYDGGWKKSEFITGAWDEKDTTEARQADNDYEANHQQNEHPDSIPDEYR
jgi:hypothetical protein